MYALKSAVHRRTRLGPMLFTALAVWTAHVTSASAQQPPDASPLPVLREPPLLPAPIRSRSIENAQGLFINPGSDDATDAGFRWPPVVGDGSTRRRTQAATTAPAGPAVPKAAPAPGVPSTRPVPAVPTMRQSPSAASVPAADPAGLPSMQLPAQRATQEPALRRPRRVPPAPEPEPDDDEVNRFVINETAAENVLTLYENRPRLLTLRIPPIRTYLPETGDEIIALRFVDPDSATQIAIEPLSIGSTVLTIWFPDPESDSGEKAVSWLINVTEDPRISREFETLLEDLETELNRAFPNSAVSLTWVGTQVVVRGQAKDVEEASQILRIVSQSIPNGNQSGQALTDLKELEFLSVPSQDIRDAGSFFGALNGDNISGLNQGRINNRIVNLIEVAGIHQIMLKVTVAEVNRSASRAIGANLDFGNPGDAARFFTTLGSPTGGASFIVNRGDFELAIRALKELNLARSLAEPTLTTLNGHPANFNVGGSFPVPVVTGQTATGLQGVEFQQFGVQLNFIPVVMDHNRIRLTLQANVSTRDEAAGTEFDGAQVPGLTARTFMNTVELREGETIAVAGLIQTNLGSTSRRVPFAGDIPFIGRLFSSDGTSYDEQELIVLVTPWLVNPVNTADTPLAIPGSDYFEPDDLEFFLKGSITGHIAEDYRSPVRTDIHKMKAFRRCEQQLIIGQPGHSNGLMCPPANQLPLQPGVKQ